MTWTVQNLTLTAVLAVLAWIILKPFAKFRIPRKKEPVPHMDVLVPVRRSARIRARPELTRLQNLVDDFARRHDYIAALDAAAIYQRGAYPFLRPDDIVAAEIFRAVAAHCPDPVVAAQATRMYFEVFGAPIQEDDRAGEPIPTAPGRELLRLIEIARPIAAALDPQNEIDFQIALAMTLAPVANEDPDRFAQSSHDHGVVRSVQATLESLPGDRDDLDAKEIRAAISEQQELSDSERRDALAVLRASLAVEKDRDALAKVWSKIQEEPDPTVRSNRVETLARQLASGKEDGVVVCSTGRISRMVSSLMGQDGFDGEVFRIRTTDVIGQEINQMAAFVREQVLSDSSHPDRLDYGSGIGDTEFLTREMERRFRERVRQVYIEELKMTPQVLEPLMEAAIASF